MKKTSTVSQMSTASLDCRKHSVTEISTKFAVNRFWFCVFLYWFWSRWSLSDWEFEIFKTTIFPAVVTKSSDWSGAFVFRCLPLISKKEKPNKNPSIYKFQIKHEVQHRKDRKGLMSQDFFELSWNSDHPYSEKAGPTCTHVYPWKLGSQSQRALTLWGRVLPSRGLICIDHYSATGAIMSSITRVMHCED